MIPFFGLKRQYQNHREELLSITDDIMRVGIYHQGPYTEQFKAWLIDRTKSKHAILCHSGTQALEIIANHYKRNFAIETIQISDISYPATLNAFVNVGFDIELHDTDINGLLSDTNSSVSKDKVKCLVGLYGASPIKANCMDIVDGAQHWLVADNIGFAMAISFDPTKNLSCTGNGGAIVTNNTYLKDFAEKYIDNGKPYHDIAGTNSKLGEIDCAHLSVKSKYIDIWQNRRREIRNYYIEQFKNLPVRCLSEGIESHADQKFVIEVEDRTSLQQYLRENEIETKIHYPYTLSSLPIAKDIAKKQGIDSNSSMLMSRVLSLPIYPELFDSEVSFIAKKIKKFY